MKFENYYQVLEKKITKKKCLVGIVGVGYVGLNLLIQFNKNKINTIGFDTNIKKINMLKKNLSPISYLKKKDLKLSKNLSEFDSSYKRINLCDVIIICLPTPVKKNTRPDLSNITNYVKSVEKVQGIKIACLEEISLLKKWINKKRIKENIRFYGNCEYSSYLKRIIN